VQRALAGFLRESPHYADEVARRAEARRNLFRDLLAHTRLRLLHCGGTYFQLADYSAVSDLADTEFCRELVIRHGVAAIPLSPFEANPRGDRLVRFCFAKEIATLEAAAARLARL
jgi:methionine aminotransferase